MKRKEKGFEDKLGFANRKTVTITILIEGNKQLSDQVTKLKGDLKRATDELAEARA